MTRSGAQRIEKNTIRIAGGSSGCSCVTSKAAATIPQRRQTPKNQATRRIHLQMRAFFRHTPQKPKPRSTASPTVHTNASGQKVPGGPAISPHVAMRSQAHPTVGNIARATRTLLGRFIPSIVPSGVRSGYGQMRYAGGTPLTPLTCQAPQSRSQCTGDAGLAP
jgi:hypothetical protein